MTHGYDNLGALIFSVMVVLFCLWTALDTRRVLRVITFGYKADHSPPYVLWMRILAISICVMETMSIIGYLAGS